MTTTFSYAIHGGYDPADGLGDGYWTTRPGSLGVQVWVSTAPERPPMPPERDVSKLIACPTCHAHVDQSCKTRTGHTTTLHKSRLTPRLCRCGASLDWRRRNCDACAPAALKESKAASARRIRAIRRQQNEDAA